LHKGGQLQAQQALGNSVAQAKAQPSHHRSLPTGPGDRLDLGPRPRWARRFGLGFGHRPGGYVV
jgi:hypothetical protein